MLVGTGVRGFDDGPADCYNAWGLPFVVVSPIDDETIAVGKAIRELERILESYGSGRWRKRKGIAIVELRGGAVRAAELHWYEATGVGRKEFKIKRFVD